MTAWHYHDKSVEEFYKLCELQLSKQAFPVVKKKHMWSAIQTVRYVLKELMVLHGEDHVLSIINHGSEIKKSKPTEVIENYTISMEIIETFESSNTLDNIDQESSPSDQPESHTE